MSAIRGTGLPRWVKLSVTEADVKTPRRRENMEQYITEETHGLWGFFNDKKELLTPPENLLEYGSYTVLLLTPCRH
jgi:hypothetical protein